MYAVILALATYRLSVLLSRDDGPGHLFKRLRGKLYEEGFWYDIVTCTRCNSVWIGTGLGFLWACLESQPPATGFAAGLAFSAVTMLLDHLIP